MIAFPNVDPVAFQIGFFKLHWYGIAYVVGIGLGWYYLELRSRERRPEWGAVNVSDIVFYVALGAVAGGRLGYILFYNLSIYYAEPLNIFAVWKGGMSFHGGVLGVTFIVFWQARKLGVGVLTLSDFILPALPIGLGLGRLANFINQELWGTPTDVPWGVVFTNPGSGGLSRHPTQLYEAVLEGLVLFIILHFMSKNARVKGEITGWFFLLYGCFRGFVEFLREPDIHIGHLYANWLTMGQLLSIPMVAVGVIIIIVCHNRKRSIP